MAEQSSPRCRVGILSAAVILAFSPFAAATERGSVVLLPAVRVEGTRPAQADTAIDATELQRTQARDLEDMLQRDPGIAVGGGGNAVNQKIYVRGVEDTLMQVTVDGATQSGYLYHHQGRVLIDPALLKSVDVEKGTAGASAGPGALAGAIRIETVDARDLLQKGQPLGIQTNAAHFSNDGWRAGASMFGRLGDAADFLIAGMRQDTQDYRDGDGNRVANSAAEQNSVLSKLNWYVGDRQKFSLSHNRQRDEGRRNLRPHMISWDGNQPMPQALRRETTALHYTFDGGGALPSAVLTLYRNDNENMRTTSQKGYFGESVTSDGLDLGLTSTLGAHELKYGMNYREDESAAINPAGSAGNSGREEARVAGLYLEDRYRLSERWQLSGGLRFDDYDYTDNHGQTFDSRGFSPSAGIVFQASEALRLNLSHARALRGVGLKEAYLLDNGPPSGITRNAAEIDPEKARNTEFGVRYALQQFEIEGALFRQIIDDYILTGGGRDNAGRAEIDGYELAGAYRWGELRTRIGVAHSKPKLNGVTFDDGSFGLGTAVGRTWTAGIDYALPRYAVELGWSGRLVEEQDYTPVGATAGSGQRVKDGYTVHDVYAAWKPTGQDKLRLTLSVKNLFDTFYYDQASYGYNARVAGGNVLGYPEPGRDIRLEANLKF